MTISLVTGVAGFIGSNLADALLNRGDRVIGIDHFNDYYDPLFKRKNIAHLTNQHAFQLIEADLQQMDWSSVLSEVGCSVSPGGASGSPRQLGERVSHLHRTEY